MSTLFPREGLFDHAVNARDWVMERNQPKDAENTFTTHWPPFIALIQEALLLMYGKDTLANDYVLPVVGQLDQPVIKKENLPNGYTFFTEKEFDIDGKKEQIYFSNLLSWRKLLPPMGILKFVGFLTLVLFGTLDRLLQMIQLRPYKLFITHRASDENAFVKPEDCNQAHPARKAFWVLYMGCLFIPVRLLIYTAFKITFGVIRTITQPADSIIRTWLRFYDSFETINRKTNLPFYISIVIALSITIIASLALFAPATMGGLSSTAFLINSFIHHIPFMLNTGLEIFSKICLSVLCFAVSFTLCERIVTFVRDEVIDIKALFKGDGGSTFIKTFLTSSYEVEDRKNSVSSLWTNRCLIPKVDVNAPEDCLSGTAAFFGASPNPVADPCEDAQKPTPDPDSLY